MAKTKDKVESEMEIVPFDKKSFEEIKKKAENAAVTAGKVDIKTEDGLREASTILSNVKMLRKFLKQEKDKILDPIKAFKKMIDGVWAPVEEQAEQAEESIKRAMADYHEKVEAENAKKAATIATRAQKEGPGSIKPETAIRKMEELGQVASNVKTEQGTSTFSKIKKVRIINEAIVPEVYWKIDEVVLRVAALMEAKKTGKIGEVIPGVEVYEETVVGARV